MLFSAVIASIFALASAKQPGRRGHQRHSPCSKNLAEIVFEPSNYWADYMRKISYELKDIAESYDEPEGISRIFSFENKYQVGVAITEPLGMLIPYFKVDSAQDLYSVEKFFFARNDARVALNQGAFNTNGTHYIYSFLSFADDAQMVQVNIFRAINDNVEGGDKSV